MSLSRLPLSRVSSRFGLVSSSPLLIVPFPQRIRHFSSGPSNSSSNSSNFDVKEFLNRYRPEKLRHASTEQLFHLSSPALLALAPVAMILSPSILAFPVDVALGVVIPFHAHRGMTNVIEDYVPRDQQCMAKWALLLCSTLAGLGLMKVNLCGPGITESVKSLWREPPKEQKKKVAKRS